MFPRSLLDKSAFVIPMQSASGSHLSEWPFLDDRMVMRFFLVVHLPRPTHGDEAAEYDARPIPFRPQYHDHRPSLPQETSPCQNHA